MTLVEGTRFTRDCDFDSELRKLKVAGMRALGLPESLVGSTQMRSEAIDLFFVQNDQRVKMLSGSVDEMRDVVRRHEGEFMLAVRI